jgi:hypothetical protein
MWGSGSVGRGRSFLAVFFVLAITFCLVSGGIFKANTIIIWLLMPRNLRNPLKEAVTKKEEEIGPFLNLYPQQGQNSPSHLINISHI